MLLKVAAKTSSHAVVPINTRLGASGVSISQRRKIPKTKMPHIMLTFPTVPVRIANATPMATSTTSIGGTVNSPRPLPCYMSTRIRKFSSCKLKTLSKYAAAAQTSLMTRPRN
jgi:hypothetical protein